MIEPLNDRTEEEFYKFRMSNPLNCDFVPLKGYIDYIRRVNHVRNSRKETPEEEKFFNRECTWRAYTLAAYNSLWGASLVALIIMEQLN